MENLQIDPNQEVNLKLTFEDISVLSEALSNVAFGKARPVVTKMESQINTQLQKDKLKTVK